MLTVTEMLTFHGREVAYSGRSQSDCRTDMGNQETRNSKKETGKGNRRNQELLKKINKFKS